MLNKILKIALISGILILCINCENPDSYKFERKLVVNGELIAGQSIDSIFVTSYFLIWGERL